MEVEGGGCAEGGGVVEKLGGNLVWKPKFKFENSKMNLLVTGGRGG